MPRVHLRYEPYDSAGEHPNVIVDGTPTTNTTLTLSHWPGSPGVPADVEADLSAQMAFRYLDHPHALHGEATLVSNNHFDQDGTVSIFTLVAPDEAMARRPFLEDVAAAGDFGTYRFRDAARVSMALSAMSSEESSPSAPLPGTYGDRAALLYGEVLARFTELVDHVDRFRDLWAEEDAALSESEAAVVDGSVTIEEHPDVDVAVVTGRQRQTVVRSPLRRARLRGRPSDGTAQRDRVQRHPAHRQRHLSVHLPLRVLGAVPLTIAGAAS